MPRQSKAFKELPCRLASRSALDEACGREVIPEHGELCSLVVQLYKSFNIFLQCYAMMEMLFQTFLSIIIGNMLYDKIRSRWNFYILNHLILYNFAVGNCCFLYGLFKFIFCRNAAIPPLHTVNLLICALW